MEVEIPQEIITEVCNPFEYICISVNKILESPKNISDFENYEKYIINDKMWDSSNSIYTQIPKKLYESLSNIFRRYYTNENLFELKEYLESHKISFHKNMTLHNYLISNGFFTPSPDMEKFWSSKEQEIYNLTDDIDNEYKTHTNGNEIIQNYSGRNYIYHTKDIVKNLTEMIKSTEFNKIYCKLKKKI